MYRTIIRSGYKYFWKKNKYIAEHRYLMEEKLGRELNWPEDHVHHINGNKLDNRLENLQVISGSDHQFIHSCKYPDKDGFKICTKCLTQKPITAFNINRVARNGRKCYRTWCTNCRVERNKVLKP